MWENNLLGGVACVCVTRDDEVTVWILPKRVSWSHLTFSQTERLQSVAAAKCLRVLFQMKRTVQNVPNEKKLT